MPEVTLAANKNDWETLTEMQHFRDPLSTGVSPTSPQQDFWFPLPSLEHCQANQGNRQQSR